MTNERPSSLTLAEHERVMARLHKEAKAKMRLADALLASLIRDCTARDCTDRDLRVVRDLTVLRLVAVNAGNTALVEMTDHACLTRDADELEAVWWLYIEEFRDNALVNEILETTPF